ncbi:hypothetical protein ACSQ67_011562 [Phaseolus vulgaris]
MKTLGELSTGVQLGHQKKPPREKKCWGPTRIGEPRERKTRGERQGKKNLTWKPLHSKPLTLPLPSSLSKNLQTLHSPLFTAGNPQTLPFILHSLETLTLTRKHSHTLTRSPQTLSLGLSQNLTLPFTFLVTPSHSFVPSAIATGLKDASSQ